MKKIVIFFLSLTILTACGPSRKDKEMLGMIESLAKENPDSALRLLDSLPASALKYREYRSRATIAEAEVRYQKSQIMDKDSLLSEALDFYRLRERDPRRQRAYYLSGYQHYLKEEYGNAILDYLNAEHTASLTADTLALGLIYREIGNTFKRMEDYTNSFDFFKKSHDMFKACNAEKYYKYSIIDLARSHYNIYDHNACINLLNDSVFEVFKEDTYTYSQLLRLKGKAYMFEKDYDNAIECYNALFEDYREYVHCEDWRNIGDVSFHLKDYPKTKEYNDSLLACDPQDTWLVYLLAQKDGDYKTAFKILHKELYTNEDYFIKVLTGNTKNLIFTHYQLLTSSISKDNQRLKLINTSILIAVILSIIIITVSLYKYKAKQIRIMNTKMGIIQNLTETVKQHEKEIAEAYKTDRGKTFLNLPLDFNALELLCTNYYAHETSPALQKKFYKQSMEIIRKLQTGGKEIKSLTVFIDEKMDNLYSKFCADNPNLNDIERRLFIFIVLGFSSMTISVLLGITINQVYAKKTYLKTKIKKTNSSNTELFLQYF